MPPILVGTAFTTAQGRSLGMGRGRMTGRDLDKPFFGIRAAPNIGQRVLSERCTALLVGLPEGAFFTHLTAARLWPLPLPKPNVVEPIHVGVPRTSRVPRRSGVAGHQVTDPLRVDPRGLREKPPPARGPGGAQSATASGTRRCGINTSKSRTKMMSVPN